MTARTDDGRSREATSPNNADRVTRYLNEAPASQKSILSKALAGTASPRAAIKARCLQCCNYDRGEVRYCQSITCALHRYRPFQESTNVGA